MVRNEYKIEHQHTKDPSVRVDYSLSKIKVCKEKERKLEKGKKEEAN